MGGTSENTPNKKHICTGILAHVDSGKTTLSEALMYVSGNIRTLGRVDYQNAFLDTYELERARGITIFSKQAVLQYQDLELTLLDTPGHVDFSAEMERTLQVLDYAILVISGADGVQGHTQTLWKLLARYEIPTFLFVNKMDQEGTDRHAILGELQLQLSGACVDFSPAQDVDTFLENVAVCDEEILERYLETGDVSRGEIARLIAERKVFPCYFGSALKLTGVKEFLDGLNRYTGRRIYPDTFGAKVYKIARDEQGNRLTYLKVTGGNLRVKDSITVSRRSAGSDEAEPVQEKINQIRIYSGAKYVAVQEAEAGTVCAVTGPEHTCPGQGIGGEPDSELPYLEPVLNYEIRLPDGCDVHQMLLKLRQLEEEDPMLRIVWNERLGEIHAQVMGEVQIEILKSMIRERFGVEVEFGTGNIVYRETITAPVEGVGHFEPLRHYAEVHLLLEPLEPGSGLQFEADCSEEMLDRNWQRLILTHLTEKEHIGVLTGSPITDMRITLVAGRAHLKHTEGGDFRQATYRAVRQGLRMTESVLLEPWYEFRLQVPQEMIGRALADVQRMHGKFDPPQTEGEFAVLTGSAPVAAMRDYPMEVVSYTRGRGRLSCTLKGYEPCHNAEEVIAAAGYDPESDPDNPTGSVFCTHGAGFYVKWDEVREYMHVDSGLFFGEEPEEEEAPYVPSQLNSIGGWGDEKELQEIFERTYGTAKRERSNPFRRVRADTASEYKGKSRRQEAVDEYLLVDGYNVIFAWDELRELAKVNIDAARDKLMDILCNYQGCKKCTLILVFDAYKVKGNPGSVVPYHNIHVVYTKEAETADQYIEKVVHEIGRKYHVTVATSDNLEQIIIRGQGASLISSRELQEEIREANEQLREEWKAKKQTGKNYLFDYLPEELEEHMEQVRLGKKK